jgi:hypothetical protein
LKRIKDFIEEERRSIRDAQEALEWMLEGRHKHKKKLEDQAWYRKMEYYARMQRAPFRKYFDEFIPDFLKQIKKKKKSKKILNTKNDRK